MNGHNFRTNPMNLNYPENEVQTYMGDCRRRALRQEARAVRMVIIVSGILLVIWLAHKFFGDYPFTTSK